jgi:hypothetical protein
MTERALTEIRDARRRLEREIVSLIDGIGYLGNPSQGEAWTLRVDNRWLAVARTDIEKGFLALDRALRDNE